jgi:hypothetical protein
MTSPLTAHLENWSVAHFGHPLDFYVLVGVVTGHQRLNDGNVAVTSDICLLATDLSYAITSSCGRKYSLGRNGDITIKGLKVLALTAFAWRVPEDVSIRTNVDPQEIFGMTLRSPEIRH